LEGLDLSKNKICVIRNLKLPSSLKWLILSQNEITKIDGLDKLWKLQCINLDSNKITELMGIVALLRLEYISILDNPIKELDDPIQVINCASLKKISLDPYVKIHPKITIFLNRDRSIRHAPPDTMKSPSQGPILTPFGPILPPFEPILPQFGPILPQFGPILPQFGCEIPPHTRPKLPWESNLWEDLIPVFLPFLIMSFPFVLTYWMMRMI
jgi:hypothetical protein